MWDLRNKTNAQSKIRRERERETNPGIDPSLQRARWWSPEGRWGCGKRWWGCSAPAVMSTCCRTELLDPYLVRGKPVSHSVLTAGNQMRRRVSRKQNPSMPVKVVSRALKAPRRCPPWRRRPSPDHLLPRHLGPGCCRAGPAHHGEGPAHHGEGPASARAGPAHHGGRPRPLPELAPPTMGTDPSYCRSWSRPLPELAPPTAGIGSSHCQSWPRPETGPSYGQSWPLPLLKLAPPTAGTGPSYCQSWPRPLPALAPPTS